MNAYAKEMVMSDKNEKKEHGKDDDSTRKNEPRPCPRCGEPGCFPGRCIKPPKPGAPK